MRLAFYAPMKPPGHPTPSGDRAIARALILALEHAGAKVDLACTLRTRDGRGDVQVQHQLFDAAQAEIAAVVEMGQGARWQAWVTYHNYYKAPDLVGPAVAAALGIPYVQIEATRARKRLIGPWAGFAKAAEAATDAAALVFHFSHRDAEALLRDAPADQLIRHLDSFLTRTTLPAASTLTGPILSVGMMRKGDKFASYQIIAKVLALLPDRDWRLDIAGDGPARQAVEALFADDEDRVRFLGQLDADALHAAYENASLFLWPGVNEALGMVYLEAQAAGLPVVAQDRPGMRDLLAPAPYPRPEQGPEALAARLCELLQKPAMRQNAGDKARAFIAENHLLPKAASTLMSGLDAIGVRP